jgi:hypothetical protein
MPIDPRISALLENLEFHEHQDKDKAGLYLRKLDMNDACGRVGVTAYIDFRKNNAKGRRFYTVEGIEDIFSNDDDIDAVPVLMYFKQERDKILGIEEKLPAKREKEKALQIGNVTALATTYGIPPELANLFFMKFDEGLYIKNPGLLHLANKKGYSRIEITDKHNEKTNEWEAECNIYPRITKELLEGIGKLEKENQTKMIDFLTKPTNGTGRASKDNVKMTTMHKFLREMAQTRATNRALRNYTGYGGSSYEELPEGQTEVIRRGDE